MFRQGVVVVAVVASCKSGKAPEATEAKAPESLTQQAKDAGHAIEVAAPDAPLPEQGTTVSMGDGITMTYTERVCERIDRSALAKALQVPTLAMGKHDGVMKGGDGPESLMCSWNEKTDAVDLDARGLSFGFSLEPTKQLEDKDALKRFVWEPFDGLGQPARIAVAFEGLHMQTIVKGLRLHGDIDAPNIAPSRLDKRLVAAMKLVIAQLPDDAGAELK